MILTCPECKARYIVSPSALLPHGRTVRCAKCSHSWFEAKPKDDVEVVQPENTAPTSVNEETPEKDISGDQQNVNADETDVKDSETDEDNDFDFPINKPRKRHRPVPKGTNLPALQNQKYGSNKMGWISLAIFVTAIISSFMIFQNNIIAVWPASQKLYMAIGLDEHKPVQLPSSAKSLPIEDRLKIEDITPKRENINNISHLVIEGTVNNITKEQQTIPAIKISLLDANRQNIRDWSFTPKTTHIEPSGSISFTTSLPSPPSAAKDISVTFAKN